MSQHHAALSLKDEEEAFTAVRSALRDAHHVFVKGVQPVAAAGATPLTPEQCIQLLDVYLRLILETSDDASAYVLSRTFQTEFLEVLMRYMFQPLVFNPTSTTSGYSSQQSFMDLRAAAAKALNHVLLRSTSLGAEGVAASCFRATLDTDLMPQLLATLGNAAIPETIRCSTAEALFILILRFGSEGQSLFLQCQGVAAVTSALVLDSSTVVRNYCGSLLREVAEAAPAGVALPNTISVCLKVMATDSSTDARILAAEVLMLCIRNTTETRYLLLKPHALLEVIEDQLGKFDGEAGEAESASPIRQTFSSPSSGAPGGDGVDPLVVREAICRLFQTCCLVAFHASIDSFFAVACDMRLPLKLCRLTTSSLVGTAGRTPLPAESRGVSLKLRASLVTTLRFVVQYCPHVFGVPAMIVNDFPSLSSLLKSVIDAGKQLGHNTLTPAAAPASPPRAASTGDAAFDAYCVELCVAVALLSAQSPTFRRYLQRELLSVPLWATTLKASLLGCLGKASLDFYGSLDMIDATGHHMNGLEGVEWSDANKPRRQSVLAVFERQESRAASGLVAQQSPPPLPETHSDQEWQRRCRLSFVLLNFAVHLSLSVENDNVTPAADQIRARGATHSASRESVTPARNSFATPATPRGGAGRPTSAAPSGAQLFPNVSSIQSQNRSAEMGQRSVLSASEREGLAVSFDKFNSSFQLTLQLAECYAKKQRDDATYVSTNDGFVVRTEKLKNPWGPVAEKVSLRSWTVKDVQDGDLFYFALPFDDLTERSIGIVEERGRRHLGRLKKTMVTVSQNAKGRRWFLYDCVNFVLPRTFNILNELRQMCVDHGEANLRFPVFLFREKEMHLGERCVHPGNIIEVVDQVRYYFSQKPTDLVGADDATIVSLKRKLESLRGKKLQANDDGVLRGDASDDDDDGNFRGHGAISSESEGEY